MRGRGEDDDDESVRFGKERMCAFGVGPDTERDKTRLAKFDFHWASD